MIEPKESLSERELDILRLVATGASNKEIAHQLVISPNTVKVHLRNIFAKIGVASRTEATLYAIQNGLVNPGLASETADSAQAAGLSYEDPRLSDAGLPGITPEGQESGPLTAGQNGSRGVFSRPALPGMLMVVVAAFLLIGAGMFGSRFLTQANQLPTITVQSPVETGAAPVTAPEATAQAQLKNARWSEKKALPSPRKGMGAVTYEDHFYIVGGETSQGVDGALYSYDPSLDAWKTLAKKPTPVTGIQAALLGERIYVPGGRLVNGKETNLLEVYNPRQDTWETRAPLPVPLSGYAIATFEGDLYLFGGKNGSQYYATVYQYDPKADQWTKRAEMSSPRAYAAAIADSEKIYVVGGYDGKHALTLSEVFFPTRDPTTDKPWETLAPLPEGRYAMGIAHLVNIIYLLGGLQENGAQAKPAAIQYLTRTNEWLGFDQPNQSTGGYPALFTFGNFLYLFGGETPKGLLATGQAYQAIYTISSPIQIKP